MTMLPETINLQQAHKRTVKWCQGTCTNIYSFYKNGTKNDH